MQKTVYKKNKQNTEEKNRMIEDFAEMLKIIRNYQGNIAFTWKDENHIVRRNYEEFYCDVKKMSIYIDQNYNDALNIVLFSKKNYWWFVIFFAIINSGKNIIPIYAYNQYKEYCNLSNADLVIYDKVHEIKVKTFCTKYNKKMVCTNDFGFLNYKKQGGIKECVFDKRIGGNLIIYTTGTNGSKKPVILSQKNILYAACSLVDEFKYFKKSRLVSFLPCDHILDIVVSIYTLLIGSEQFILKKLNAFQELYESNPSVVAMTPIMIKEFFSNNMQIKDLFYPSVVVSGGSDMDAELFESLKKRGIRVLQGYGCTECPVIAINDSNEDMKYDESKVIENTEIKILNGQILVRSEGVFAGYWGDVHGCQINHGWLETGDLGRYNPQKNILNILGRIKNFIVLPNGLNVSPEPIERRIESHRLIKMAIVYREDNYLSASIYPYVRDLNRKEMEEIQEFIININEKLEFHERIRKYYIKNENGNINEMGKKEIVMRYRNEGN